MEDNKDYWTFIGSDSEIHSLKMKLTECADKITITMLFDVFQRYSQKLSANPEESFMLYDVVLSNSC